MNKLIEEKIISVCHRHIEEVPLIYTFAFTNAEYWCPACGMIGGMLGTGRLVPWTQELQDKHDFYKKESKSYLKARCTLTCAYLRYKGKDIKFKDLPKRSKDYWIKKSKQWSYKIEY